MWRGRAAAARQPAIAALQRGEVARDDGVAGDHDRLGEQRADRLAALEQAVAAHQVGAAEASVAALALAAVAVGGGAEVDADRVRRGRRRPARGAQAHDQVEVLPVGEDPLVEPADRLPGAAAVGRGGAGRAEQHRLRVGGLGDRAALVAGERAQRGVGGQAHRVDVLAARGARTARRRSRRAGRPRAARPPSRGSPGGSRRRCSSARRSRRRPSRRPCCRPRRSRDWSRGAARSRAANPGVRGRRSRPRIRCPRAAGGARDVCRDRCSRQLSVSSKWL